MKVRGEKFHARVPFESAVFHDSITLGVHTERESAADRPRTRSAAELYELFHAPDLNKPDGLGDYVQNFQGTYPR